MTQFKNLVNFRKSVALASASRSLSRLLVSVLLFVGCWLGSDRPVQAMPLPTEQIVASLFSFAGTRPTGLGIHHGQLLPCPATPNCVSSFSQDAGHHIAPLQFTASPEIAFNNLKNVIQSSPRTKIITATDTYLYAEFTSALMGFVDDVEFSLDRDAQQIQVRSASRLGESDLGVNRQRIETIRAEFQQSLTSAS